MEKKLDQVTYQTNQYFKGQLMLLKEMNYTIKKDTVHNRYFVSNANNELVYLDQFSEMGEVKFEDNERILIDFSNFKQECSHDETKKRYVMQLGILFLLISTVSFLFFS